MKVYRQIDGLRAALSEYRCAKRRIGFVPTMGFLHEGHLSLVRRAVGENHISVVSIFVNPTQFGPNEDYDAYPRDFERDEGLLEKTGVNCLFYPSVSGMYPDGFSTSIKVSGLTEGLCGAKRPGHFDGVATVVAKLLSIVAPDNLYMGLKDYQQFKVVSRMAADLNIQCNVNGVEIVREHDGLAMSSRNVFLQKGERESALSLYNSFSLVKKLLAEGIVSPAVMMREVVIFIHSHESTRVDYVEFVNPDTLKPAESLDGPFVCMLAVFVGKARLIDNMTFNM